MNLRPGMTAVAAVACLSLYLASDAAAQDVLRSNAAVKAIRKVKPSVVALKVPGSGNKGPVGTGVIIDERGYIVTSRHVVCGADKVVVRLLDDTELCAKVIVSDVNRDLAILKVSAGKKLPALPLGPAGDIEVGEDVMAIGHPYGYAFTVSRGIVSALERSIELPNGVTLTGMIQTDAAINPGNSGGPLININGEFIGIVTALRDGAQNIAFATNTDTIKRVLAEKLSALKIAGVSHGLQVEEKVIAEQTMRVRSSWPPGVCSGTGFLRNFQQGSDPGSLFQCGPCSLRSSESSWGGMSPQVTWLHLRPPRVRHGDRGTDPDGSLCRPHQPSQSRPRSCPPPR
jgi:S1-C subfamily serine protease